LNSGTFKIAAAQYLTGTKWRPFSEAWSSYEFLVDRLGGLILGYAAGRVLVYGKGGGAWVGGNNFTVTNVATGSSVSFANNNINTGWTAGGGIEWAFYNNWTARVEYDYVGLNDVSFTVPTTFPVVGGDVFTTHNRNIQLVTVGINYLFNWAP